MTNKNGWFKVLIKSSGTFIKLFAPQGSGNPILYDDISNYLISNRLYEYDKSALARALANLKDTVEIKISPLHILPQDETLKITISDDRMSAIGRFYPPVGQVSQGGQGGLLSKEDVIKKLGNAGIKYGIGESLIDEILLDKHYCTDYVLARGKSVVQGSNAKIKYHFNTDLTRKPKRNEDGSVDFHKLDIICHCKKDQLLATLIPANSGEKGMDILGNVKMPAKVNNKVLRHGRKAYLSEDGLKMFSSVDGHVSLVDDRVIVSDIYEIADNVDSSTGDVDYEGNVLINGNVLTGYSVRAHGDIEIRGVVEGAYIEAGGQIILRRGMQGMNKGVLKAGGNIITKFLENTEVIAGGYITTDSILHSKVSAKGDIIVGGKRGYVTGGEIRSGSLISVKTAGSQMGTSTVLAVGISPEVLEVFNKTEKRIADLQEEKEKILKVLNLFRRRIQSNPQESKGKLEDLKRISRHNINIDTQLRELREKHKELLEIMKRNTDGEIIIYDKIYPGCKLIISNSNYYIREEYSNCKFIRDNADIKSVSI